MNTKKLLLMGAGCLFSTAAYADYQCDVGIEWLRGSVDVGSGSYYVPPSDYTPPVDDMLEPPVGGGAPDIPTGSPGSGVDEDYDGWAVGGHYYFSPVETGGRPADLAPFMTRVSGVGGQFGQLETDETNLETDFWDIDVRVVFAERWVIEAELGSTDFEQFDSDIEVDLSRASLGYYVAELTELKVSVDREDADFEEYDRWSAQITHVQQFENNMTWQVRALVGTVSGDHDLFSDTDGYDIEVDMSLYFNPKFGVGFDYANRDRGDAGDVDAHELWANYFVTDKLSLELSYFSEDHDGRDIESDGVTFEAKYRI